MGRVFLIFFLIAIFIIFLKAMQLVFVGISEKIEERKRSGKKIVGSGTRYLCDTCRYDYGTACSRPERPNAVQCPDYKPR